MECSSCHTAVQSGQKFCPSCGKEPNPGGGGGTISQASGLSENIAGMLSYITIVPAIIFLVLEPYSKNRFIRFHAFQSIFLTVASVVIQIGFRIVASVLSIFALFLLPVVGLIGLGFFILWIVCVIKAFNHEKFKIPFIGELAEQQAEKG